MVHVRRAKLEDLEAVERVECESFHANRFERDVLLALLNQEGFITWVAEMEGSIVGYGSVMRRQDGPLRLLSIAVVPELRERGVGKALLNRVRRYGSDAGAKSISLEVRISNVPAINLYLECGYRIKGMLKDYYSKGREGPEDALYMVLQLR
jgi:ribosomal-protein-alanine N-acetyltransferase